MSVTVKWGTERLSFALPAPSTPLSHVRKALSDYTHLDAFKLIYNGAILKDDDTPISAYRIHANSTLQLIPITAAPQPQPQLQPVSATEAAVVTQIQAEVASVRQNLTPDLNRILQTQVSDKKDELRVGELLLQALLRIDGISPERSWDQARAERKAAVKEIQSLLDILDAHKAKSAAARR
ncbi:hypothetical protein FA15DRAFT_440871 [Coprinopsis marcescibilis]|uniref:BAG domain-containing protein n=1 Tax=Coprinopsis marcescibilis TaxID=230819 RepID=A0A5C3KVS3_COPMA|nr:hypothetical protein FA15DRAFT_440871 [Coprinopsis marcescibilis]